MSLDNKPDVFICYSSKDGIIANKICFILELNNLKCWIAPRDFSSTVNYTDEISDAIKSAKIVVLVYSKDSSQSKYVKYETDLAFSNNKPIISFNIDESLPDDDMEYYLKITQWVLACPDTDDAYETLVNDALMLCNEAADVPVVVDFTNFKQEDLLKNETDYISLLLLFIPIYWASFVYMGLSSSKMLWVLFGFVYLIPTLLCAIGYFNIWGSLFHLSAMFLMFNVMFILFWVFAIIHGLRIRKEFLTRKFALSFASSDDELFEYLYDEYMEF